MLNGSRTKPAKRTRRKEVSINNPTALWKDESRAIQHHAEAERIKDYRQRQKKQKLLTAAHDIRMAKITSFFSQPANDNCHSSSAIEPLVNIDDEAIDVIIDEALAGFHTTLNTGVDSMHQLMGLATKSVRERLWEFKENQERLLNPKGIIMGNAYIKFEEYLREGNGDSTGGFSELKAGRIIAKTVFPRGKKTRKNASQNEINKKYWYRYRARSIITGYRYLVATGCLMPEQRGKCKGTSLIHDPHVRHICFAIIARLGQTWSARTFRDKVSADLYSNGMIKEGKKIGRSTATYYLRQLG
jgi:hypothetical protein